MSVNLADTRKVNQAINNALQQGEIGMQVAVYHQGKLVIDAWGGVADKTSGAPVNGDTLFNVMSVTKALVATAVHIQAEKGLLEYDAPIAEYWPEWGCHGKERATVRDALTHRTGAPQMPAETSPALISNWEATVAAIARLKPLFPPGSRTTYHSMSFGWILGEVVRRTDPLGRRFGDYIQQEICDPLGITDLWIGIPDEVEGRIARLINDQPAGYPPEDTLFAQCAPYAVRLAPEIMEQPAIRRACLPGVGGIFNARSAARFFAMLAQGGSLDGSSLLSVERIARASLPQDDNQPDPVLFDTVMPLSQGGYWLGSNTMPLVGMIRGQHSIGCPGAGGSIGWADPENQLAVAFCHNRMTAPQTSNEHPFWGIANAIYDCLGLGV